MKIFVVVNGNEVTFATCVKTYAERFKRATNADTVTEITLSHLEEAERI